MAEPLRPHGRLLFCCGFCTVSLLDPHFPACLLLSSLKRLHCPLVPVLAWIPSQVRACLS